MEALASLPALLEPARKARQIAVDTIRFFHEHAFEHHADEERELFPAVLASADPGQERQQIQELVLELTSRHRAIEAIWRKIQPALLAVANGEEVEIDPAAIRELVDSYQEHARDEEKAFLPLARDILSRHSNDMAALDMSLHLSHSVPRLMKRWQGYI